MSNPPLNPHEAIEVKELIIQQTLGIKQLSSNMELVQDTDLKNFMQDTLVSKKHSLYELKNKLELQVGGQRKE